MAQGNIAVEGQGGDARTYETAAILLDLGLSPEVAFELLRDEWNPHCVPPWEEAELAQKCLNAAEYAQNDPGAWAVKPAAEVFSPALIREVQSAYNAAENSDPNLRSRFYPRDETEQEHRPAPRWLIPDLLPAEGTAMIYGPPGSYKSFLALDMALSLAAALPAYGHTPEAPVAAVYVAAEGAIGMERLRRPSWRMARGVEAPLPFYTVDTMPLVIRPDDYIELIEQIQKRGINPGLLVLDTTARALGGMNENDARDVGQFIEAVEHLKRTLRCTVLVVHHTGKDSDRGARGSSAFLAGLDTGLEVRAHEASRTVELHVRRQKDAEARETPWTFQGHKVGPSLVFFEIGTAEHRRLVRSDDAFEPAKIGRALRELGAVGEARAVETQVLASHLTPPLVSDTVDAASRATNTTAKTLRRLARGSLSGYTAMHGKNFKWCLPEGEP